MTRLLSSTTTPSFQHLILSDLNGDGNADVIVASQSDNQVSVMINNGVGGFGAAVNLTGVTAAWDVSVADVNGDGLIDIAASGGGCTTTTTYGAYWFQNNGSSPTPGWSTAKIIAASAPSSYGAQRMSLGDINNDGYMDAVVLWEQVRVFESALSVPVVPEACRLQSLLHACRVASVCKCLQLCFSKSVCETV